MSDYYDQFKDGVWISPPPAERDERYLARDANGQSVTRGIFHRGCSYEEIAKEVELSFKQEMNRKYGKFSQASDSK